MLRRSRSWGLSAISSRKSVLGLLKRVGGVADLDLAVLQHGAEAVLVVPGAMAGDAYSAVVANAMRGR